MQPDLTGILERLLAARVELILVGGLAAVTHGAPITTVDVDIVHQRATENVDRLMTVLADLNTVVREPGDRRLRPERDALLGPGHCLFATDLGPLDCLGAVEGGLVYEDLVPHSELLAFGEQELRVLGLAKLLDLKRHWTDEESVLRSRILERLLASTSPRE